ncbi:MAG: response regulator [Cyclobacteriaceae bacterium]|nr:response regulator [Cyclobacteriaceae bacterium]MCH8516232.1 response regulator [Cyclobacteriaceae bacterium]
MKISALIVDDEERARNVLRLILNEYLPFVIINDTAGSVQKAHQALEKQQFDLIFLDIEMPGFNGFELLEFINQDYTKVIITSAYSEYYKQKIENLNLPSISKPVEIDQLLKLVHHLFPERENHH